MAHVTRPVVAGLLSLTLLAAACGDDDDTDTGSDDGDASGEVTELDLTIGAEGLEGVPESFAGGAVEVTLTVEGDRELVNVDFTRVDEGTTADQFAEEFVVVFEGGPFPDYVQSNSGVQASGGETVTSTILVEPGLHMVWYETETGDDEPAEIVATEVEVTEGTAVELPESEAGEIVASDYEFEVDVTGPGTLNFRNDGPDQFHHAVLVDFGTNDPAVVEEALPQLVAGGEDDPPPDIEGFDPEMVNFDFAGSSVFGPGLGGTFEAEVTEGNTYAVVCFISDRAGGPPHAIAHDMFEVFTVG